MHVGAQISRGQTEKPASRTDVQKPEIRKILDVKHALERLFRRGDALGVQHLQKPLPVPPELVVPRGRHGSSDRVLAFIRHRKGGSDRRRAGTAPGAWLSFAAYSNERA